MLAIHKGPELKYSMVIHSAGNHAAMLHVSTAIVRSTKISDPEATERHLTSIGNTEGLFQDADGRIYDDIVE